MPSTGAGRRKSAAGKRASRPRKSDHTKGFDKD